MLSGFITDGCQETPISTRPKIKIISAVNRPPQLRLRVGHALKYHCVTAPQHLIRLASVPRAGQLARGSGWHGMAQFASGFRIPFALPRHFRIRCSGAGGHFRVSGTLLPCCRFHVCGSPCLSYSVGPHFISRQQTCRNAHCRRPR